MEAGETRQLGGKMIDVTEINLAPFLAAAIEEAGGEIKFSYETLISQHGDKGIEIAVDEETQMISLTLSDGDSDE